MAEQPPQFVELVTKRFILRSLQPGDACEALCSWTLDPLIAEMMNAELKPWDVELQRTYFSEALVRKDRRVIGIFPKDSKAPIGMFILGLNPSKQNFIISTLIGDLRWRGMDVMSECSDAIYSLMFDRSNYYKAKANVLPNNRSMIWLLAKTKIWTREGILKRQLLNQTTGERMDVAVFGLLKTTWMRKSEGQRTGI